MSTNSLSSRTTTSFDQCLSKNNNSQISSNFTSNFISIPSTSQYQQQIKIPSPSIDSSININCCVEELPTTKSFLKSSILRHQKQVNSIQMLQHPVPLMAMRKHSGTVDSNCSAFSNVSAENDLSTTFKVDSSSTKHLVPEREMEIAELLVHWKQQSISCPTAAISSTLSSSSTIPQNYGIDKTEDRNLYEQQVNNNIDLFTAIPSTISTTPSNISEQIKVYIF